MKRFGILFVISAFVVAVFIQMNITHSTKVALESTTLEAYKYPKKVQRNKKIILSDENSEIGY